MYQNNVLCDLFIGKGAGKKMLTEIGEAKKSVKIISPFLSASLIWELIVLKRKGIDVELVTTDAIIDNTEHSIGTFKHLISQKKVYDKKAEKLKNFLVAVDKITWLFFVIFLLGAIFLKVQPHPYFKFAIAGTILSFCLGISLKLKLGKLKVFDYHYEPIFPLKLLIAPENADFPIKTYIHSKVYIIDDEVMYWGSLNFTAMGTQDNYETRIRTVDTAAISKMLEEFDYLMKSSKLPTRNMNYWGNMIYFQSSSQDAD